MPVAASQILLVLSPLPLATSLPSGDHATDHTQSECPVREHFSEPVNMSQIFIIPSLLPEATKFPQGDHATENTSPECPVRVHTSVMSSKFHILTQFVPPFA